MGGEENTVTDTNHARESRNLQWKIHTPQRTSISPSAENPGSKGVFVLLNDHAICSALTQALPGSLEEADSAPER